MYLLSYHSEMNADFINKVKVEVDHESDSVGKHAPYEV